LKSLNEVNLDFVKLKKENKTIKPGLNEKFQESRSRVKETLVSISFYYPRFLMVLLEYLAKDDIALVLETFIWTNSF
jgi:hypothetical protein